MSDQRIRRRRCAALSVPLLVFLTLGACADNEQPDPWLVGGKAESSERGNDIPKRIMKALPERPGMLDVARNPANQWFVRLVGPKGDIYLTSNPHPEENAVNSAILNIKADGVLRERYATELSNGGCRITDTDHLYQHAGK